MSVTVDIWAALGGLAVLATAIGWLVRLQGRQQAHEDLCAERYKHIASTHDQLVKVSDERHQENLERLEEIRDLLMERR